MASHNQALYAWLTMVTKGHHDSPKVTAHVQELLQAFPTLRPKYDYYSHLSGQREPMLCTYGTLPVNYRGQTYHIPVALWFPVRYPECPPLVRVEPTANMAVIPGKCVNSAGQVHHPYLSQWATQPAAAQSLIELLRALQVAFGNESPVGMKPATPNQAQHHHHSLPADAPRPPPVSEQRPLHQTMPAQVTPNDIQHTMSAPGQIEDTAHESMASPPPNLETTQSFEFHHGASYPRPGSVGNASSATLGLADIPNPNGSFYPLAAGNHSLETAAATPAGTSKPLPLPNGTHATMPPQSSLTTDTPTLQSQPPNLPLPPVPQPGNESHDHIDLATLRTQLSLIDDDTASPAQKLVGFQVAVYDKLTERLDSFNKSMKHKTTHLLAINQHLNHGEELVEKEKRQLLSMQRKIENNIGVLESKHEELQRQESIIEKLPPPDPTTIFRGKQPAYEQLFDLVADDNAIEDTIYYLGKALSLGKIELTLYLKLVRSLAHDQFMCRTLIQKIRHQAQLPPA